MTVSHTQVHYSSPRDSFMCFYQTAMILLMALFTFPQVAESSESDYSLFLLLGQSNMAGRGVVEDQDTREDDRVFSLTKELAWVKAKDPIHFDKANVGVGPGLSFGRAVSMKFPAMKIGLIPCAVGGTSIGDWHPGAFHKQTKTYPYDDAIKRALYAKKSGVIKAILWHQGESDRGKSVDYSTEISQLVSRLRIDLGDPSVPVIAGELASFMNWQEAPTVKFNKDLRALEAGIDKFYVVSSDGFVHGGDRLHYDSASARLLGQRFAEKFFLVDPIQGR